jgi:hypothetical protein
VAPAHTWETLRRTTLARQFPTGLSADGAGVVGLVGRLGPIQAQAARAPFLTVSSRLPGTPGEAVVAAYESYRLVRSSSLRGTVHTSVRPQHGWLDATARRTSARLWARTLRLSTDDVTRLRAAIEGFTAEGWVPHTDLHTRAVDWLASEGFHEGVAASSDGVGFGLFRSHSALLRRPLTGGWHQQGRYGYRAAPLVLGDPVVDPDEALTRLVRQQLEAFGPATRLDIAWWTGEGLRHVDAAVQRLGDELVSRPGPDSLDYLDLVEPPSGGQHEPGLRLLPEYDGLLLGYAPAGRARFADARAIDFSWNRANGVHSPTVLVDGTLRGTWRLTATGPQSRVLVSMLPGEPLPDEGVVGDQASAVAAVLGTSIEAVEITSAAG